MRFMQGPMACFLSVMLVIIPLLPAQAAMLGNDQIINSAQTDKTRNELQQLLDRETTQKQLQAWGVSPDWVKKRVDRLTGPELARINQQIGDLDAGGDAILGVLLIVFIVFVITDVIGATDIFPFIHPIR